MYITMRNIFLIPDDAVTNKILILAVKGLTWTIFTFCRL